MSGELSIPAVFRNAIRDSELDRTAKLVAYTLSTYMDSKGSAFPSKATLAAGAGLGRGKRAVDAAIDRLEAGEFIEISRSRGGNSNTYRAPDALYTAHLAARFITLNGADPAQKPRTNVRETAHPGAHESTAAFAWTGEGCFTNDTNLYLHGPVGTGKTGLAWSLMRHLLELGGAISGADFVNVRQLLAQVRRSFTGEVPDPLIPLRDCHYAHLLVLDDIGAERCTEWARETLATLIEDRYTRELLTIFTSNYSPSGLAARLGHDDPILGQRVVSRIVESCVPVNLDGTDYRLASAKEAA